MHVLRILRVGFVYLSYALIILTTVYVVVPVVAWVRGIDRGYDLFTQRGLYRAAALLRWIAERLGVIGVSFVDDALLTAPGPRLIVANHPSLLDATLLVAHLPQLDHIVEQSWARNPIVRRAVVGGGYVLKNDPRRVIEDATRHLAEGRRLVVFPEGSRSPAGSLHPFQRGAARIALASGCDLLPVVIDVDPPFGKKAQPWWDIPDESPRLTFTVGPPIAPRECIDDGDPPAVAARKVTQRLEEYFRAELGYSPAERDPVLPDA